MAIEAVNGTSVTNYNQTQEKKKSGLGRMLIGAGVSAVGGAYGGHAISDHFTSSLVKEATKNAEYDNLKNAYRNIVMQSGVSEDLFETAWKKEEKSILEAAKKSLEQVKSYAKKANRKWAIVGGVLAGGLTLLISKLIIRHKNSKIEG